MQVKSFYLTENRLFTLLALPDSEQAPTLITRSPYVDADEHRSEEELRESFLEGAKHMLEAGFAVVFQHCRGRGKSGGDCIPYINEREDGLALQAWIRTQPHYDGSLYLSGKSYTTTVHYVTAPFAPDIKGAVFGVQDCERYNITYRNGNFKHGLHGKWYTGMYKRKTMPHKNFSLRSWETLPLSQYSRIVFGESAHDLDEKLKNPDRNSPFWDTHEGGSDARNALASAHFPMLFVTGMYDIYTGGIFDMWRSLTPEQRSRSALLISANDHSDKPSVSGPDFPESNLEAAYNGYMEEFVKWVAGKGGSMPIELGKVTYYRIFENKWHTDDFAEDAYITRSLGESVREYVYNPFDPPSFNCGLSRSFGGAQWMEKPNRRYDVITSYSEPFERDTTVRGRMTARLRVRSDCEDSCFILRIGLETADGDFPLRDDIQTLCFSGSYTPGEWKTLALEFDEHSFEIKTGQRLRFDIASADAAHFVRHTNLMGLFSEQTSAKIAHNAVDLGGSEVTLPIVNE